MNLDPAALLRLELDKSRSDWAARILAAPNVGALEVETDRVLSDHGTLAELAGKCEQLPDNDQAELDASIRHARLYLEDCALARRIELAAVSDFEAATDLLSLDAADARQLGRKGGQVNTLRDLVSKRATEMRALNGQLFNRVKNTVSDAASARRVELAAGETARKLREEAVDVTRPGRAPAVGRRHPLTATFERVSDIMTGLGFQQMDGPEVEDYDYNFAALNFQEEHPALDEQASFYVTERLLLRTQTTALQGRVMPVLKPPFRVFTLGRCFRYEAVDATHSHTFHQVDAFMVDRKVTLADLKGTLAAMMRELFGEDATVRFRPDFFPFVEPGVEVAVKLPHRWMEIGGAGMIHPNVLRHVGIDPEEWSGFAFGLGLDRMPMVRHGIDDIRLLFENDLRMLKQF